MLEHPGDTAKYVVRSAAKQATDLLAKQQDLLLSEHSAFGRWLTASLLALNGAGVLAVFNAGERLGHAAVDCAPFVAGILAALISGVLNQWANQAGSAILGAATAQMWVVAETGEYTEEAEKAAEALEVEMPRRGQWPARAGWFSAALFLLGTIITGVDKPPLDLAAQNRCIAIQRDMLSARPLRANSPELFRTLGCRPQGEGSVYAPPRAD